MKKILKLFITLFYVLIAFFAIKKIITNYTDTRFFFLSLSLCLFFFHVCASIAPKKFFDMCWKLSRIMPDDFDYETSFSKLENISIGFLILSNILGIIILF